MKILTFYGVIFLMLALFFSCKQTNYNYEEAVRSLKVLNSDMMNLFTSVTELDEMNAINFLWNQSSTPLPFKKEDFYAGEQPFNFNFDSLKGTYLWDTGLQEFVKQNENDRVEIFIPDGNAGLPETLFSLMKFNQVEISSRPQFPVEFIAELIQNEEKKLSIKHFAEIEDDLPLKIQTEIIGKNYKAHLNFNRTRKNETGTIDLKINLEQNHIQFIDADMHAEVTYSSMGYYFRDIEFKSTFFKHQIKGFIDYEKIDPTSKDYIGSWNSHTEIEIFESGTKKVGNIVLGKTHNGDLHDYFIRYNDGKEDLLIDYFPFLDKILNFKY